MTDAPTTRPRVVLIGPPGSGKSTVAAAVGRLLDVAVRDTDDDVQTNAGKTISDIFLEDGEAAFRALERDAVATALHAHDGVLALGGGAVLDEQTQALLEEYRAQDGAVVYLSVTLAQAAPRVGFNTARPLLLGNPRAQWQTLMEARRPVYERLASTSVATDTLTPEQVAEVVVAAVAGGER